MTLVIVTLTCFGLYLLERSVTAETQHDLQAAFTAEVALLRTVRDIRHATLAERCRALVRKARIHAALEDDALDLLYPSAKEELGDAVPATESTPGEVTNQARFYRFLNLDGRVIPPVNAREVGILTPEEEEHLNFSSVPQEQQSGYLVRSGGEIVEVIATPIISTESGEAIAALVTGFPAAVLQPSTTDLQRGMWLEGRLYLPALDQADQDAITAKLVAELGRHEGAALRGLPIQLHGVEHMLFSERLNPRSLFPPAYEVGVYSLSDLLARQWQLRRNGALGGGFLLCVGILASLYISAKLAEPVRQLAEVSAENRVLRERAEAALEAKSDELARTARFSADASHQLKTPVAVLRAGLDELLARDDLAPETREEVSALVHQTFRLNSIIEDLLLLSRVDTGRLQLTLCPVDLTRLVETCLDDLQLLHEADAPEADITMPPALHIVGDTRYTFLIVQNLIENAHKYGTKGEPLRIAASGDDSLVSLVVANRGEAIPRNTWEHIFERFHRGQMGENIPGHGLGLNLARQLARLHGGDLKVIRSDGEWTEFEATFRAAKTPAPTLAEV